MQLILHCALLAFAVANKPHRAGKRPGRENAPIMPRTARPLPETRAAFVASFSESDYVFDLAGLDVTPGPGGTIQSANIGNWPVLSGHGVSSALFTIEPCGINLPHVHPRATEMTYVINAEDLVVAFVNENGEGVVANEARSGVLTFFPQGLIHYQQNFACTPATYISILNSDDPGVQTVATQFFKFDDPALTATLGISAHAVDAIRQGLPEGPALAKECRKRCGLEYERRYDKGDAQTQWNRGYQHQTY